MVMQRTRSLRSSLQSLRLALAAVQVDPRLPPACRYIRARELRVDIVRCEQELSAAMGGQVSP